MLLELWRKGKCDPGCLRFAAWRLWGNRIAAWLLWWAVSVSGGREPPLKQEETGGQSCGSPRGLQWLQVCLFTWTCCGSYCLIRNRCTKLWEYIPSLCSALRNLWQMALVEKVWCSWCREIDLVWGGKCPASFPVKYAQSQIFRLRLKTPREQQPDGVCRYPDNPTLV